MRDMAVKKGVVCLALFAALAICSWSVTATSTVVTFRTPDNHYEVELYVGGGSEESGGIAGAMISWPGYEHMGLPFNGVKYHMDKALTRAGAKYVNSGDSKVPPSFTLEIEGNKGRLIVGKRVIPGTASWIVGPYAPESTWEPRHKRKNGQ
ncbi:MULTISPECIES: hypothetical protein [unclassified Xanthomonas]|uniref:hypothetical protein n=1 Tax=unclassified Xanthomonas TaxID=2643310 RepID=UPI002B2377EE|nr:MULTISPECIES: hypothetical protein [unclassified Xanthomonas]MEA9564030.1 hypothetical protein [Xanthomonas sp. WHRI 8932A]MEA9635847.1 hypothetical protein [Xanthomonas sp. WHRI 8812E]